MLENSASEISVQTLEQLHPSIQRAVRAIPASDRYLFALSGGLDSMALLTFALPYLRQSYQPTIQIIHVHHGLSAYADEWAAHCQAVSDALGCACHIERVDVIVDGKGLEAAAREARYKVFERYLSGGGVLLQGHHQNDQAETVLMRLLRGAGPEGMSGIPQQRSLSGGLLFRPWLDLSRSLLESEIQKFPVKWVEDDSNSDLQFDRNFLRHEILPLLEARWPNVLNSISRTAERSEKTHQQLLVWCEREIVGVMNEQYVAEKALDLKALSKASLEQQRFLVRYWLDLLSVEHPSEKVFERIWSEVIPAESDALPALRWGGNHLRRFNGCLFYLNDQAVEDSAYEYEIPFNEDALCGQKIVDAESKELCQFSIGGRELYLAFKSVGVLGGSKMLVGVPKNNERVTVRSRRGGESLVLPGSIQNKALKKILQAKKIAPWRRLHIPLIFYGDTLVAVILGPNECLLADGFQASAENAAIEISWA
jgi:tRNA(Ile)-lysidine synthase